MQHRPALAAMASAPPSRACPICRRGAWNVSYWGQIKIQESNAPEARNLERNFALTPIADYPATTASTHAFRR